ncbi:MAG: GldG family protein [Piscirickettsiaceae bacterium]|nr:GldG family protein [Piscirickettsiaceae bacterium]
MNINSKIRANLKIQNGIFYILLIVAVTLLAQFSLKTNIYTDWTQNSRHSLSDTSTDFLKQLQQTISVQVFVSPTYQHHAALESLITRYQRHSDFINAQYINPDFSPDLVRSLNIQQQGQIVISSGDKQQHVFDLSEQSLTNALIAVSRSQEQWLMFIEGHGERSPFNQANFNLSTWGEQLKQKGFKLQGLNLVEHSQIPNNTTAVIIASPEQAWLDGEIEIIKRYINDGGNVLWLAEPESHQHLSSLAEHLSIDFISGTIIDPNTELLGINDPQFALITEYANHPIGIATTGVTLFPQATAMEVVTDDSAWQSLPLLISAENTWSETAAIDENLELPPLFDLGDDTYGPLYLGYLLTQTSNENDNEQRIAIIGDGDFLSNTYIGNGSNLELGIALMNWLTGDDDLISIPVKTTLDNQLELTKTQSLFIGLGFLIVIPLLLLIIGFVLWRYRRRR